MVCSSRIPACSWLHNACCLRIPHRSQHELQHVPCGMEKGKGSPALYVMICGMGRGEITLLHVMTCGMGRGSCSIVSHDMWDGMGDHIIVCHDMWDAMGRSHYCMLCHVGWNGEITLVYGRTCGMGRGRLQHCMPWNVGLEGDEVHSIVCYEMVKGGGSQHCISWNGKGRRFTALYVMKWEREEVHSIVSHMSWHTMLWTSSISHTPCHGIQCCEPPLFPIPCVMACNAMNLLPFPYRLSWHTMLWTSSISHTPCHGIQCCEPPPFPIPHAMAYNAMNLLPVPFHMSWHTMLWTSSLSHTAYHDIQCCEPLPFPIPHSMAYNAMNLFPFPYPMPWHTMLWTSSLSHSTCHGIQYCEPPPCPIHYSVIVWEPLLQLQVLLHYDVNHVCIQYLEQVSLYILFVQTFFVIKYCLFVCIDIWH